MSPDTVMLIITVGSPLLLALAGVWSIILGKRAKWPFFVIIGIITCIAAPIFLILGIVVLLL